MAKGRGSNPKRADSAKRGKRTYPPRQLTDRAAIRLLHAPLDRKGSD